jgi:predicted short-subunit dehydrogenase-like oxidoreductase (DUF2520 family)
VIKQRGAAHGVVEHGDDAGCGAPIAAEVPECVKDCGFNQVAGLESAQSVEGGLSRVKLMHRARVRASVFVASCHAPCVPRAGAGVEAAGAECTASGKSCGGWTFGAERYDGGMIPRIAIYGAGRFGRALYDSCLSAGLTVRIGGRVWTSSMPKQKGVDPRLGAEGLLEGLPAGSLVVLSVPDDTLAQVARTFAAQPSAKDMLFVHPAAAVSMDALEPLADIGARTGVFHILQSFPNKNAGMRVAGSYAALTGPAELLDVLHELCERLGLHPFTLLDEQRAAYHAAASMASNALTALLDVGQSILADAGIEHSASQAMLLPLVRGTLDNIEALGTREALTGPIVRGDTGTVRKHLDALQGSNRDAYVAVARAVVALAKRAGTSGLDEIEALLA